MRSCGPRECRTRIAGPAGRMEVRERTRVYALHEIPGWERPLAERAGFAVLAWGVRQAGGSTGRLDVGLGSRLVSGPGAAGLELRCSLLWIDEVESEHDGREGAVVTRKDRQAAGTQCLATSAADSNEVRWRFDVGVAPPRDSLADVYDALVAEASPLLGPRPPVLFDRVALPGDAGEAWTARRARSAFDLVHGPLTRLEVQRGDARLAVLHVGQSCTLDLAPGMTPEESGVLRLLAALLTAAPETIAF
jgi:hypothetical protein